MPASNARASAAPDAAERVLVITRVFDAPRELVFEAMTNVPSSVTAWTLLIQNSGAAMSLRISRNWVLRSMARVLGRIAS